MEPVLTALAVRDQTEQDLRDALAAQDRGEAAAGVGAARRAQEAAAERLAAAIEACGSAAAAAPATTSTGNGASGAQPKPTATPRAQAPQTAAARAMGRRSRGFAMANPVAKFKTSKGEFDVELYMDQLPITCSNFVDLSKSGFYDGLTFHRVIKGFMCQFGCPNSIDQRPSGMRGEARTTRPSPSGRSSVTRDAGGNIPDELVAEISNEPGTISMANTGQPNSGGSQFFLNTVHNSFLDYFDAKTPSAHPVFGKVVAGMDVVSAIEGVKTGPGDRPVEPVSVETVVISE
ncbi:peptidyl-prolyl cis-trans isomerase [Aureococcus anophagefferens]|nr:peptidyl-prolyl cis-trans isomerase [Aureococcus anophagefferens]